MYSKRNHLFKDISVLKTKKASQYNIMKPFYVFFSKDLLFVYL